MPFPHHDAYWTAAAGFLKGARLDAEPMTAPTEFNELFPTVYPYAETFANPPPPTPVVVIHKGLLADLERGFLERVADEYRPGFANEVFVVFAAPDVPAIPAGSPHLVAFTRALETLPAAVRKPAAGRAQPKRSFDTLSVEDVRAEMNRRYSKSDVDEYGGYEHPHAWDRVRFAEVNRVFARLVGPTEGLRVLEIGCGIGRNVPMVAGCKSYLGIDLSDVAIAKAAERFTERPDRSFRQMDAMALDLPANDYDLVLGVEIVEHVQDVMALLRGVARVLAPGGRFVFNSANRDSLHLRVTRALGLPENRSTYEHFREFGYAEMCGLLADVGLTVETAVGVFLHPYRGLPALDARVQAVTLDDPDVVAALRELGDRAGPEYGYEFAASARKPAECS